MKQKTEVEIAELEINQAFVTCSGWGCIPSVTVSVLDRNSATRNNISKHLPGDDPDTDLFEVVGEAINQVLEIDWVRMVSCNCNTIVYNRKCDGRWKKVRRMRFTIRLHGGYVTTQNIGAEHADPVQAFILAYIEALNQLFEKRDMHKRFVLSHQKTPAIAT